MNTLQCIIFIFVHFGLNSAQSFNDERVVGGVDASIDDFPFMASLRSKSGHHSCGASIINQEWVLTAAHCVHKRKASDLTLQYGVSKIDRKGENIVKISKIVIHERYKSSGSKKNDIAVLQLESPLQFKDKVSAVSLPSEFHEVDHNTPATLLGWGFHKSGGSIQKNLQMVDLVTYGNGQCAKQHSKPIFSSNICAGVPYGGKGQCSGDSGGPLIVDGIQLGIVSWSKKPCTVKPYPGVYVKVSHYIEWIKNKTKL